MSNNNINNFKTEIELRNRIVYILKKKNLNPVVEIPFLGRSIDIVYINEKNEMIAIEVKQKKNIGKALEQAKYCLLGADYSYVFTTSYNVTDKTRAKFKNLGVGLIFLTSSNLRPLKTEIESINMKLKQNIYAHFLEKAFKNRYGVP